MAKAKKKRQQQSSPGGAPEWMVTFGDMMSLLLCFFVIIVSLSEIKKDTVYQEVVTAIQEAFGYQGGVGVVPTRDPPVKSMQKALDQMKVKQSPKLRQSKTDHPGPVGENMRVKTIREGMIFTLGGNGSFDRGSWQLNEPVKEDLMHIADIARGRNNRIEIRGHADSGEILVLDPDEMDLYDLGYRRAKAVMEFLVGKADLRPELFILGSRADYEPVRPRAYRWEDQQANRRVEIVLTEALVDDFNHDASNSNPDNARGG